MYIVECDGVVLFDDTTLLDDVQLISPKLELGNAAAGVFTAILPPNNRGYDICKKVTSTVTIKQDNEWLWEGRIMADSIDFYHRKTISCEGALAYLNDTVLVPYNFTNTSVSGFISTVLSKHNNQVAANRRIYAGACTVVTSSSGGYIGEESNYDNTLTFLLKHTVEVYGGYMCIRKTNGKLYLDYYSEPINQAVQTIDFGTNLLDFVKDWNYSNICTVVIPRGKQESITYRDASTGEITKTEKYYVTVKSVNNNSIYVANQTLLNRYGRFEKVVDFSDCENARDLLNLAKKYVESIQFETMAMTVTAIDLHWLTRSTPKFKMFDSVHCFSIPHGLDADFPITQMSIPLDQPENVSYTLGVVQNESMTSIGSSNAVSVNSALNDISTGDSILKEAFRNSTEILNQKTTGYVNIVNQGDHSQALVISNTPTWTTATKYWQFNMNGLGYFTRANANSAPVNKGIAITMDGQINANFITVGTLNADRITAGAITSVKLANGAVTTDKVGNNAITESKILSGAVTAVKISDGAVVASKIAANSITGSKIQAGAITGDHIQAGTIYADRIKAKSITADRIQNNSLTGGEDGVIAKSTITDANIKSLNADKITAGSISADRISSGTLDAEQITITSGSNLTIQNGTLTFGANGGYINGSGGNIELGGTKFSMNASEINWRGSSAFTGIVKPIDQREFSVSAEFSFNYWSIEFVNGIAMSGNLNA